MNSQSSKKNCDCTITDQHTNCTGDHARNLSDAARYMLDNGGDIEMPRRVRTPSRQREIDEATIAYVDPPATLPPRQYRAYESSSEFRDTTRNITDGYRIKEPQEIHQIATLPLRDSTGRDHRLPGGNLVEDTRFRAVNREPLTKFESLRIGDSNLRQISIGGFQIDVEAAARKASEVVPLPPARLPIIFQDENLNFYHHFFNGIYEVIEFDDMMDVLRSEPAENGKSDFVLRFVEEMMTIGYERSDSEALTLIKRMLQSTFRVDTVKSRHHKEKTYSLFVESNIWGFPYIESMMTCSEIDLRYWLQACYKAYETAWFSTFKSTRVPDFARRVKSRGSYSSQSSSRPSLQSVIEESDSGIADMLRDDMSVISQTRRRSSSGKRKSKSTRSSSSFTNNWFTT